MPQQSNIFVIIIGRNEGPRLVRCLASAQDTALKMIYVDSGSTDGSQNVARAAGAQVVQLSPDTPFTAARARNAGLYTLNQSDSGHPYVQFIDGDCELQPGWLATATAFLEAHPDAAVACGRRREQYPEASVYNKLIDQEWDTPVGLAKSCGGDALMRVGALQQVGGFNPDLIAGEEPELCLRLRAVGWTVWRLDAEMTLHDAALTRFSQWWNRNRRAGHAYAEGTVMHGHPPEHHGVRETRSALFWGGGIPLAAGLGLIITPWAPLVLLAWPAQVLRLGLRANDWTRAFFLTLGKIPEALGIVSYWWGKLVGMRQRLIEYK